MNKITKNLLLSVLVLVTCHLSLVTALRAQGTPGTVRCPAQTDTLDSLFRLTDSARANLSATMTSNATSATVGSTALFPSSGSFKIDGEVIYYTSKTSTTFEGLVRGASGTTAVAHAINALVQSAILSAHHNTLAAAIICAQEKALAAQVADADLSAIAGLSPANDDVIQRKSNTWINRTIAQLKADLAVTKSDVGLGNADNTSDANKPVSTAQQTALDAKVPTTRTVNGHALSANVTVDKSDVGLGNADNTSDVNKPVSTAQQTAIDAKVTANSNITGATKTKITYDAKGLVTAGTDATTADVADSTNKRYVTDAQRTVIQNTSGTNTGDQDLSSLATKAGIQAATYNSCVDAGANDSYSCSVTPAVGAYANGLLVWVQANTANTGAATFNLSSIGAVTIKKQKDQDLADGDIKADQWILLQHDGTFWQLLSPVSNAAGGGGITNSAGANVVPKSNGTNLVASQISDDGGSVSITALGSISLVADTSAEFVAFSGSRAGFRAFGDDGVVQIGDINGSSNGTRITIDDSAQIITLESFGATPFQYFGGGAASFGPATAGSGSFATALLPASSIFLGNAANNSSQITGTFTGNRVATLPDRTGTVRVGADYTVYTALVTQTGTAAPVATVRENTTGVTFTWARTTFGTYTVTASGAILAADHTFILHGNTKLGTSGGGATIFALGAIRTSTTVITVTTGAQSAPDGSGGLSDGQMTELAFEIRIYP